MKKATSTLILLLFHFVVFPYQTEFVVTEGIEYGNSGPLSQGINTLNGNGTITIKGDIEVKGNITIPEGIELNFFRGNKLKINGNVTVTINGSIKAGSYHIFDLDSNGTVDDCNTDQFDFTFDDGKVKGNLVNEFIIPQWWGVDDTGKEDCSESFQKAIESFPNVKKFVANGEFLIYRMLFLNQNNRYYDFSGATFRGVSSDQRPVCINLRYGQHPEYVSGAAINDYQHANTSSAYGVEGGGMITVAKRYTGNENELVPYSVSNVTVYGGLYIPQSYFDVALSIHNAKNVTIQGVNIYCYDGLRGIAIQLPNKEEWKNRTFRTDHVIIKDVIQQGGVNVINIDLLRDWKHYVKNVIINNVVGHDITGTEPDGKYGYAFRITNQNDPAKGIVKRIENISISNVILSYVNGGLHFNGATGNVSNVQVIGYGKKDVTKTHKLEQYSDLTITNYRHVN